VTALLLTTLAITIVASLFWQQQVQVRSIENQRLQLQKQWILRGALDWARLILREDGKYSAIDDLNEPWAVPLSDTRLDQYVEAGGAPGDAASAVLSGSVTDAQARLNLTGLASAGKVNAAEVTAFERLLSTLRQDPSLATATADAVAASQQQDGSRTLPFEQINDLLAVQGFTPTVLRAVRDYVIFLPRPTAINANTAPAEVLAAKLSPISVSEANTLVTARRNASFRDINDLATRLPGTQQSLSATQVAVSTHFFLVNGRVTIRQAALQVQGLVERNGATTQLVWVKEL
jgi:general secretion pathway protein K